MHEFKIKKMIVRPSGYKVLQECLTPYFVNGKQIQSVLTENLNDLQSGTLVYGYVRVFEANVSLENMDKENIAWLALAGDIHTVLPVTLKEYECWIHDEIKTSLKINRRK